VILAVVAAVSSPPAHAGKISAAKAQASAAESRLNDLYAQSDAAVEAYNKAVAQLHAVHLAIKRNTVQLNRAKADLAAARARLSEFVVSSYKGSGPSLGYYVLSATSFTDLVNRVDFVNRMSDTETEILGQVRRAEREVAARQAVLKRQRAQAAKLVAKRTAERRRVEALVSQQQGLVSSLNSKVKTLIHQRNERRAAAAAAAAAAARQAAAQQPSSPTPPPRIFGPPPPPASTIGGRAVQIAETQLGVPYVWAARARPASTARASRCGCTRSSGSRSRISPAASGSRARTCPTTSSRRATSCSSSPPSGTSASTSAAAASSTLRTPATW